MVLGFCIAFGLPNVGLLVEFSFLERFLNDFFVVWWLAFIVTNHLFLLYLVLSFVFKAMINTFFCFKNNEIKIILNLIL